jgi:SAM-dependent methyltransferase
LPWGYAENAQRSADAAGTPYWADGAASTDVRNQAPVYQLAARLVSRHRWTRVADVGCGAGDKLVRWIGPVAKSIVGADQPSAIALASVRFPDRHWVQGDIESDGFWRDIARTEPELVICADVIEHLERPLNLLTRLRALAGSRGRLLMSTPNRDRLERARALGPPTNPRHVREWTQDEMELLLLSAGFAIERRWHLLPRGYSCNSTDLNIIAYRAMRLRSIPARKSCMTFLVRPLAD